MTFDLRAPALTTPIETARLTLRRWELTDIPALRAAIGDNLARLEPWIPWAAPELDPVASVDARVGEFHAGFGRTGFGGVDGWMYGMFTRDAQDLLGGIGVHTRQGPGALELGYWLTRAAEGRGYVHEAASELVRRSLAEPGTERVEIRCDPLNVRSVRVAERLGFTLREVVGTERRRADGTVQELMVWERRVDHPVTER